jgi:hypothetical protein
MKMIILLLAFSLSLSMLSLVEADAISNPEDLLIGPVHDNMNKTQFSDMIEKCNVALVTFYAPW